MAGTKHSPKTGRFVPGKVGGSSTGVSRFAATRAKAGAKSKAATAAAKKASPTSQRAARVKAATKRSKGYGK